MRRPAAILVVLLLSWSLALPAERTPTLATTTSVDATGLLDVLGRRFRQGYGHRPEMDRRRDARPSNRPATATPTWSSSTPASSRTSSSGSGFGVNRRVFARNYFIVVGPPDDPARAARAASAVEALGRVKAAGLPFVSRGDRSGTHTRELDLWALAGGKPSSAYLETGQGMAETLRIAAEKRAYTLTDTATFLGIRGLSGLVPVFEKAPDLENVYAVIAVDPARIPGARYAEAMAFIAFLTSPRGQALIGEFKGKAGRPLFEPLAASPGVDLLK